MIARRPGNLRRALSGWLMGLLVAVIVLSALFGAAPAAAADEASRADRILVISVPYLAWSDLGTGSMATLDRLLDRSAVANLSARAARRRTSLGEGYATIGAGTRAGAPRSSDGLALAPDEELEGGPAAEAYRRRYGRTLDGASAMLSASSYDSINRRLLFGGEVGSMGTALAEAGVVAAAVGNADTSRTSNDYGTHGRQLVASVMTAEGLVPGGRVDRGLLETDSRAPYGHRLDRDKVLAAFDAVWDGPGDRKVVVVEGSDLVRAVPYAELVTRDQKDAILRAGKQATDRLIAGLLERVDEERDAVLVVSPATPPGPTRLTVVGLRVPGGKPGLLRSAYTRRSGSVAIVDIGPTILRLAGVPRPVSMEGRPAEWGRAGGDAADRRSNLIEIERDARFRDALVGPVALGFVIANVLLAGLAVLVLGLNRQGRARAAIEVLALSLLGFLPATYLAALLPFAEWGKGLYFAFVILAGLGIGLAARAFLDGGRRDLFPVVLVLGFMVAVITGSAVTGSSLNFNTVFGDSPIVAGRFSGINNLTFSQLVTAVLLLAGFISHRYRGTPGAVAAVAVLAGALVVDGMPIWGADIGGVLAAVPAFAIVAGLLLGVRVGPRIVAVAVGGTVLAMAAFTLFDLSRPASQRSHLGRLFEQVDGEGWGAFSTVVERKLNANMSVLTSSPWTLMVPAVLGFLVYLVYRSPSALGEIQRRVPQLRFALTGLLVAGALGFALNDSGIAVPGMMLGVLNPVMVYLSARWT